MNDGCLYTLYLYTFLNTFNKIARVVELVDTQDLKSCGHCVRAGSIPASGTPQKYLKTNKL